MRWGFGNKISALEIELRNEILKNDFVFRKFDLLRKAANDWAIAASFGYSSCIILRVSDR